jgi:hypothetical protein
MKMATPVVFGRQKLPDHIGYQRQPGTPTAAAARLAGVCLLEIRHRQNLVPPGHRFAAPSLLGSHHQLSDELPQTTKDQPSAPRRLREKAMFPIIIFLLVLSPLYIPVAVTVLDQLTNLRVPRTHRPVRQIRMGVRPMPAAA